MNHGSVFGPEDFNRTIGEWAKAADISQAVNCLRSAATCVLQRGPKGKVVIVDAAEESRPHVWFRCCSAALPARRFGRRPISAECRELPRQANRPAGRRGICSEWDKCRGPGRWQFDLMRREE